MKSNLVIQSNNNGLDIALIENDKLVEYHQDVAGSDYRVGDIYMGKVKKILPGLNATFVDIGHEKNAFLHYHDFGPGILNFQNFTKQALKNPNLSWEIKEFANIPDINKNGDINQVLKVGEPIVVQIVKEPISTKGHRLTSQITLAGRYIVLIPFNNDISVSKKIRNKKEKKRLSKVFEEVISPNFGVIVRTAAENKANHVLVKDFENLLNRWQQIVRNLKLGQAKLLGEINKSTSIIRDVLNENFENIIVDNQKTYQEIESYLLRVFPDKIKLLKLHREKVSPFQLYNIDKQLKSLFGKIVNFGKGAYLVIEKTEAMYVIDVNSGSKSNRDVDREENVLRVNLDAAEEIARQLRLRDIGGLIVVDFIDMRSHKNQRALLDRMNEAMQVDRTQHACTPISKFGLMEITRQRVKPATELEISESCPVCKGSGELKPTILIVDDIENTLKYVAAEVKVKRVELRVHPFVKAFLNKGFPSIRQKWMRKYKMYIHLYDSEDFQLIDYDIFDKNGNDLIEF